MIDAGMYGPWAVIAGGSEGIGACIAAELAQAGINLVLIARKTGPLEEVASDLRGRTGVEVRTLGLDLTDAAMLERIREATDDWTWASWSTMPAPRTGPALSSSGRSTT